MKPAPASDEEIARLRGRGTPTTSAGEEAVTSSATSSAADAIKSKESAMRRWASRTRRETTRRRFVRCLRSCDRCWRRPKAKTAKIVRGLIEIMGLIEDTTITGGAVSRARRVGGAERRTFLRHRVELRLATLHLMMRDYPEALCWPYAKAEVKTGR